MTARRGLLKASCWSPAFPRIEDAIRGEGHGDWATYQLQRVFRNCRWRCTRKQGVKSCPRGLASAAARLVPPGRLRQERTPLAVNLEQFVAIEGASASSLRSIRARTHY